MRRNKKVKFLGTEVIKTNEAAGEEKEEGGKRDLAEKCPTLDGRNNKDCGIAQVLRALKNWL